MFIRQLRPEYNDTDVPEEYWVFKGHVDYGKDKLEIEVQQDFKNIFNDLKGTIKKNIKKTKPKENNFFSKTVRDSNKNP